MPVFNVDIIDLQDILAYIESIQVLPDGESPVTPARQPIPDLLRLRMHASPDDVLALADHVGA